jgi:hypothetical protein
MPYFGTFLLSQVISRKRLRILPHKGQRLRTLSQDLMAFKNIHFLIFYFSACAVFQLSAFHSVRL